MESVSLWAYSLEAALFFVLAILIYVNWRGGLIASLFLLACGFNVIWGGALALQDLLYPERTKWLFSIELIRTCLWAVFSTAVASSRSPASGSYFGKWMMAVVAMALAAVVASALPSGFGVWQKAPLATILGLTLLGAILLEQIYKNTPDGGRGAIRHLVIGLGSIFGFDVFIYSAGLFYGAVDKALWDLRGVVNAVIVPLLAVSITRNPSWEMPVFVSRPTVFYSTVVTVTGIYLLLASGVGYFMQEIGWFPGGGVTVFGVAAGTILILGLVSHSTKHRVKLLLARHFYQYKYDYRAEWLRLIKTLYGVGTLAEGERAVRAVADILGSDGGVLLMRVGECFEDRGRWNNPGLSFEKERWPTDFVEFIETTGNVIEKKHIFEFGERHLPNVPKSLNNNADWVLVPLLQDAGLIGCLVLRSPKCGTLGEEDFELLKTIGRQIAGFLVERESARKVIEAGQFESYHRLSAFVMHDLKNVVGQQRMMLVNAKKHAEEREFIEDMLITVSNATARMQRLLDQLRNPSESGEAPIVVALDEVARKAASENGYRKPIPAVEVKWKGVTVFIAPETLVTVLGHLIRNAQEATPENGFVKILVDREGHYGIVRVEDSGCGMAEEFVRECLFRPFFSTKGRNGMGIGAFQAYEFVKRSGGELIVHSAPGVGTVVELRIPFARSAAEVYESMEEGEANTYGTQKAFGS